jgi:hypothetical protein
LIQSMVDRLAERLKKSWSDPEGWIMLTRSYITLGEKDKAATAIKDARAALAGGKATLQLFNEALQRFKIDETANAMPAAVTDQTNEMIRSMVARLADRLKQDDSDFDGWMRLVRSYVVLGERDKAASAAADPATQSVPMPINGGASMISSNPWGSKADQGSPVRLFSNVCSKARNFSTLSVTLGWKRIPPLYRPMAFLPLPTATSRLGDAPQDLVFLILSLVADEFEHGSRDLLCRLREL